jgi:anti-anti-sigma factor
VAALQYARRRSLCGSGAVETAHDGADKRLPSRRLALLGWGWHQSRVTASQRFLELTVEDVMTMSTRPSERVLAAPEALGLDSRTAFRRTAGELLEQLAEGSGRLVIDLSSTRQVDSAGLGALMLIQRKAAERRVAVCLRGANEELRFLLVLTKLDDLFELESGASS